VFVEMTPELGSPTDELRATVTFLSGSSSNSVTSVIIFDSVVVPNPGNPTTLDLRIINEDAPWKSVSFLGFL